LHKTDGCTAPQTFYFFNYVTASTCFMFSGIVFLRIRTWTANTLPALLNRIRNYSKVSNNLISLFKRVTGGVIAHPSGVCPIRRRYTYYIIIRVIVFNYETYRYKYPYIMGTLSARKVANDFHSILIQSRPQLMRSSKLYSSSTLETLCLIHFFFDVPENQTFKL